MKAIFPQVQGLGTYLSTFSIAETSSQHFRSHSDTSIRRFLGSSMLTSCYMMLGVVGAGGSFKAGKRQHGFTLIELLAVMSIMSVMAFTGVMVVGTIANSESIGETAYNFKALLEQARTVAMAQNTYVWIGFQQTTDSLGNKGVEVVAVKGLTGQSTDLAGGLVTPIISPSYFPNILLTPNTSISGMATSSIDVSNSTIGSYVATVNGSSQSFTQLIQFSPQSETLVQTNTLTPWITIGLAPAHGQPANVAAVQVAGTTGDVSVFQP